MTIIILFHRSHYRNFKAYFHEYVQRHLRSEFPTLVYPRPQEMEVIPPDIRTEGLPRAFWVYLIGAVLVAAGFAYFSLISYHFAQASTVSSTFIPVFYAVAMSVGGIGSLLFGRLFDWFGNSVLIPLTILSALFSPLVFLGGF
jgi:predicted MFS family arabinose efflux permease